MFAVGQETRRRRLQFVIGFYFIGTPTLAKVDERKNFQWLADRSEKTGEALRQAQCDSQAQFCAGLLTNSRNQC